jgi:hypothetical protein
MLVDCWMIIGTRICVWWNEGRRGKRWTVNLSRIVLISSTAGRSNYWVTQNDVVLRSFVLYPVGQRLRPYALCRTGALCEDGTYRKLPSCTPNNDLIVSVNVCRDAL